MVPLPRRRLAAFLIALIATVSIAGTALGSPRDVINDFDDNGVIDFCHDKADYDAARKENFSSVYGDPQGAIDTALANPALVGTPEKPCPPVDEDEGGGIGSAALVAIPVGLCVVALALVFGGRRRRDSGEDDGPASPA